MADETPPASASDGSKRGISKVIVLVLIAAAILAILFVVVLFPAGMFATGVFNPAAATQPSSTGFTGFRVPLGGWNVNTSGLMFVLSNTQSQNLNITSIIASYNSGTTIDAAASPFVLEANEQKTMWLAGGTFIGPAKGDRYVIHVTIKYRNVAGGLPSDIISTGVLSGTA